MSGNADEYEHEETNRMVDQQADAGGDDGFLDPSEGDVERDEDGNAIPKVTKAGHLGKAKVRPMEYGKVQRMFGSGTTSELEADDLAALFNSHFVKPNLSQHYGGRVSADDVQGMKPLTPRAYLRALMEVSGVDPETIEMYNDGSARVEVDEGN